MSLLQHEVQMNALKRIDEDGLDSSRANETLNHLRALPQTKGILHPAADHPDPADDPRQREP